MNRREFSKEEKENIYDLYYNKKIGQEKIGKKYNCSRTCIRNLFIREGWKIRTVKEANTKYYLDEKLLNKIVDDYVNNKIGIFSLARKYHLSEDVLKRNLKNSGIKLRNYTEAKQEGRKYIINDDYFKIQSPNMAYILGLLAADGNILNKENRIQIALSSKDGEILEKINKELQNTRPIKYYTTSKNTEYAKLETYSKEIKQDLKIYNIIPQKTFNLKPPLFLNKEYWIDYIRGYFDGDGSVYKSNRTVCWNICGASKNMIEWIRDVLANKYGIINNKIYTETLSNGTIIYKTVYYGENVKKIFDILYTPNSLYMKRKKDKFSLLINPRDSNSIEIE